MRARSSTNTAASGWAALAATATSSAFSRSRRLSTRLSMRASQCAAIFGASRVASAHAVSASMYCSWPANACAVSDQETPPSFMPRQRACTLVFAGLDRRLRVLNQLPRIGRHARLPARVQRVEEVFLRVAEPRLLRAVRSGALARGPRAALDLIEQDPQQIFEARRVAPVLFL